MTHRLFAGLVIGTALLPFLGCGGEATPTKLERDANERPILTILSLYGNFQRQNGRPPKNTEELKAYASKLDKTLLKNMGIENVDKAFTSSRDGQPYQVNPANMRQMGGMSPVVIYEKVGVNGKRQTASTMGTVEEMDEEKIRKYVPNLK